MHERTAEAFDEFFRTSHAAMVGLALAMVGDVESARDLAQEAMLRALRDWRRVSRLETAGHVGAASDGEPGHRCAPAPSARDP